jgi:hypothetical protein
VPALVDIVPDDIVRCVVALLDFSYLARRNAHFTSTLRAMELALARFHAYRRIFETEGIRGDGFSLPRQHSLVHYVEAIHDFGSPNGLCSSITENKHIDAVKRPWRRSNRNKAIFQILKTNKRKQKLAAARAEFGRKGMLDRGLMEEAKRIAAARALGEDMEAVIAGDPLPIADVEPDVEDESVEDEEQYPRADQEPALGPAQDGTMITFGHTYGALLVSIYNRHTDHDVAYHRTLDGLADDLGRTDVSEVLHNFICSRTNLIDPVFVGWIYIYTSATALFYAPSDLAGPHGMHRETIRSTDLWYGQYERRDVVLVKRAEQDDIMGGMRPARVLRFMAFTYHDERFEVALVEWFTPIGRRPDELTGFWKVRPLKDRCTGARTIAVVPLTDIVRSCLLVPVYGNDPIPKNFHFSSSLIAFQAFYVNHYSDHHAFEAIPRI